MADGKPGAAAHLFPRAYRRLCLSERDRGNLASKSLSAYKMYAEDLISERHRHRFEYNNDYKERFEKAGLICSGTSPDGELIEIVELKNHPYFIAGQFHPELKSRPNKPAPLFIGLVKASKERKKK